MLEPDLIQRTLMGLVELVKVSAHVESDLFVLEKRRADIFELFQKRLGIGRRVWLC